VTVSGFVCLFVKPLSSSFFPFFVLLEMVVIQVKKSDQDTFLFETTSDTSADQAVRDIVEVWNLRIRLAQLCGGIRELARHGPMKPPDKAGLDEVKMFYSYVHLLILC
jgi:hypothetical protein